MPPAPLETAVRAARAAGEIIRRHLGTPARTIEETHHDIKLATDRACQDAIVEILVRTFPEDGIVAEEDLVLRPRARRRWIIDPLDGTVNFARGIPQYCTSIALEENGTPIAGVVYDPVKDELFEAERGGGARLNGRAIRVSECRRIEESILALGFFKSEETIRRSLGIFSDLVFRARKIRIMGAAALDGCYVACGRFDAYLEYGIRRWDVAAARILIEEAGGTNRVFDERDEHTFSILSAAGADLLEAIAAAGACPPAAGS